MKGIFESPDSGRKPQALQHRAKLNQTVKSVNFCGRQGIPLRGHSDKGTLALPDGDPAVKDGNIRALLRFRIGRPSHEETATVLHAKCYLHHSKYSKRNRCYLRRYIRRRYHNPHHSERFLLGPSR